MRLHLDTGSVASSTANPATSVGAAAKGSPGASGAVSAGGDSVGLSGVSAAFGKSTAERAARIQQLTAAVRAGTYQVSSAAVSSAIVGSSIGAS